MSWIFAYDETVKILEFMSDNNPFRWKSRWYDVDAGLYFANGRIYSPYLMQYLDASDPESILSGASTPNSLDRNAITLDNSITYEINPHTIFPSGEMFAEDPIDQNEGKSWWDLNWRKAIQWIAFGVMLVLSVVLLIIPGTQAIGAAMLYAGAKAAISGLIIGAIVGSISAAINKSNVWEGMLEGGVYGAINGFTTGAIMGFFQGLSQVVSKSVNAVDKCTPCSGQCFIAGTLVACLTAAGEKTQKLIAELPEYEEI